MKFTFTTKEEYLAYRSNWKAQYKQLSQDIRDLKFCRWFASLKNPVRITPDLEERFKMLSTKHGNIYYFYCIHASKSKATTMLDELKEAKAEAQRQYLVAHGKDMVTA